jgi:hypothetical protein
LIVTIEQDFLFNRIKTRAGIHIRIIGIFEHTKLNMCQLVNSNIQCIV